MGASDAGGREEAARRKTLTMERSVAGLRAIVVGTNVLAWFLFLGPGSPRASIAYVIIALAVPYAIWTLGWEPYRRYPLLGYGLATVISDALLITVWTYATGGTSSEFWVIYMVSLVSVAMRYDLIQALWATGFEVALLVAMYAVDGGLEGVGLMIRPAYIGIVGLAAGLLARQERIGRDERVMLERLADEHAELLGRERATVERLRELDRLRTEFVAHASHELRTPLTTLAGYASTLASHHQDMSAEQLASAYEAMGRQGERARRLIENLLDLTQLEHGSVGPRVTPVSVTSTFEEALLAAPPPAGHTVAMHVTDDGPVLADRQRLGRVVADLLLNAYLYGGKNVRCTTDPDGRDVLINVIDDGTGVPSDLEEQLFQPFHRGDNVGRATGSGLGLAICRRLVEAFGGVLSYERGEPEGARFTIRLPRAS
jgi:signal transduction histidine kinase